MKATMVRTSKRPASISTTRRPTPTCARSTSIHTKYPHRAFPYADLVNENVRRTRMDPEYELVDTGAFAESRYFDVLVEYAKADPTDIIVRVIVTNRGPQTTSLHVLPTLWFRNTWSWGLPGVFSFYEYFHGDTGRGYGASHQTGWTSLIANLLAAGNP